MNESIRYAAIAEGILVPEELQKEWLAESFIYFKPKDVVSGDFIGWNQGKKCISLQQIAQVMGYLGQWYDM